MVFPMVDDVLLIGFCMKTVTDADHEENSAEVKEGSFENLIFEVSIGANGG